MVIFHCWELGISIKGIKIYDFRYRMLQIEGKCNSLELNGRLNDYVEWTLIKKFVPCSYFGNEDVFLFTEIGAKEDAVLKFDSF